jgi:hypothetical protein
LGKGGDSVRAGGWIRLLCLLTALGSSLVLAPSAVGASIPVPLTEFGQKGSGAGQFQFAASVVANPTTGHIYAVDSSLGDQSDRIVEFTAFGEFVKAWGWGVRNGAAELQTCGPGATPPSATCLPGLEGGGAGQLDEPAGIALDSAGNLVVFDLRNARVQKFSDDGSFILAFGRGVNQTTGGDICTAASGNACQAGTAGGGDGQFEVEVREETLGNYVAIGPSDEIFVADDDRIQEFDANGLFVDSIPLPEPGRPGALALDPISGDLYFAFAQVTVRVSPSLQPDVYRLDPDTGEVLDELPADMPTSLATDPQGNVFVALQSLGETPRIIEFDSSGAPVITAEDNFSPMRGIGGVPRSLATNTVTAAGGIDLVVGLDNRNLSASARIFGPPPDRWPPPLLPPSIQAQFVSSVDADSAVVKAEINPRFWADTRFYVEYGTEPCSEGACTSQPTPPGDLLGAGVIGTPITTAGIGLEGLEPGTRYFFRFVSESTGGGPVFGEGEDELEGTFRTPTPFQPSVNCPNQEFRTGPAAFLPDCRAYEMVSPVDKAGGDIIVQCEIRCNKAALDQAAESGGGLTYSAFRAFGDAQSSPYSSQYLATRGPTGWLTHGISPVQEGATPFEILVLDVQFRAFSPDLDQAWFTHATEPVLAPGAIPGFANLYRLNTNTGTYLALTTRRPSDVSGGDYEVELQGLSADGSRAVFRATGKLTANASARGLSQVYQSEGGQPKLVSLRPNNTAALQDAGVGTADLGIPRGRLGSVFQAVSADGSRIFWSEPGGSANSNLFVRIDGEETVAVSNDAEFIGADPTGSTALLRTGGGNLVEFDVDARQSTVIAGAVLGVSGFSKDLSKVYFVSTENLAEGAVAGQPNLYIHRDGQAVATVATLDPADVSEQNFFAAIGLRPNKRATRVTPDGRFLVFMSRARLTGYDSGDLDSGEPNYEVFRYDSEAGSLACVSCNPTGARPAGRLLVGENRTFGLWGAAQIPAWPSQLYASRVLSADGSRVFFESTDALVQRDENGKRDVYQWESEGSGDCTAQSAEFDLASGGCISLISSGRSEKDTEFVDASADGSEVFIRTDEKLVSQDPGLIDIYVARVDGGFPSPAEDPTPCEGEACQPVGSPGTPPPTSSNAFVGPPTPKPVRPKKCRPGHHRVGKGGKARCVSNKKQRRSRRGR